MIESVQNILDVSVADYSEGTVLYNEADGHAYRLQNGEWYLDEEFSSAQLTLYDLNKTAVAQLPAMSKDDLFERAGLITQWRQVDMVTANYFLLYGREINYFTLFARDDIPEFNELGDAIIECLQNVSHDIKAIDITEQQDAWEIWVVPSGEEVPTCMYLFPYDTGVVTIG